MKSSVQSRIIDDIVSPGHAQPEQRQHARTHIPEIAQARLGARRTDSYSGTANFGLAYMIQFRSRPLTEPLDPSYLLHDPEFIRLDISH
jgi:hypothetical protein